MENFGWFQKHSGAPIPSTLKTRKEFQIPGAIHGDSEHIRQGYDKRPLHITLSLATAIACREALGYIVVRCRRHVLSSLHVFFLDEMINVLLNILNSGLKIALQLPQDL